MSEWSVNPEQDIGQVGEGWGYIEEWGASLRQRETEELPLHSLWMTEPHTRWFAPKDVAGQELSLSCGSLWHVKCQVGKLRPVDQVVGWINTAMVVATGEIRGQVLM